MPVVQTGVRASGLPRPPTRTIGLGEKLPPVRRPAHDSSDEEEPPQEPTEMLPDTSHTSRRPPTLRCFQYNDAYIPVPGGHGFAIAAGGTVVVASHHHVSVFYLSTSRTAISNWSTSQLHMKDAKLTCMEFRHASTKDERGTIVWIGTKEGHLFELDLQKGEVIGSKRHAHGHNYVSHIFRYGRSMLTFDESGKVLIFTPEGSRDVSLEGFPPRVFRIPEKQEFMKMIGGLLWTSTRADMGRSSFGTTPIIRIHDVFAPGSVPCAVQPPDAAGAVTSGAILPSSPHMVYLGHDNGYVSVWSIAENEGLPHCIEVLKVSATGIVSLEGVNDRIWAGGRMGAITVYDVTSRPWTVTNCWAAHKQAPVQQLFVDPLSIERIGRLSVVSIGKDQEVKLWDGLLSADWIDMELTKREAQFSTFRPLKVLIVSWNIDAALPEHLTGDPINNQFLFDVLDSVHSPDIISFGFQETVDLENHKGNLQKALRGHRSRSYEDGRVGQHLNPEYKVWQQKLESVVRQAMPQETPYTVIETEGLVGLYSCILVKRTEKVNIDDVGMAIVKRGFAKKYGNKGAIFVRLTVDDTSICIANCHLAAGQGKVQARNSDIQAMFEQEELLPQASTFEDPLAYVGGGDGTMLLDHEVVFFHGDMNYRISKTRESIITAVEAQDLASLLPYDQLSKEMKANSGFRLRSFSEGPLTFAPTYKYDRKSSEYDTSAKNRPPAWCDRILWRGQVPERVQQLHYRRWEADCSDHRPISAAFTMTVKSVNQQMRLMVKAEVATAWTLHQQLLVGDAEQFYEKQGLLCTIF
ncbi:DNase I-like protein [Athelia psychrophila]|uniref:DNase I-like protein n=1 Tax=Athelia psychrophila TaxID=1759441 RepID=A0A166HPQ0_9AGAM|nr:DNase I-like protein [Fibularhizoctonia sp. CBS 109695]